METREIFERALAAKAEVRALGENEKNKAIEQMAECLVGRAEEILQANRIDLENAAGKISETMLDRLRLTRERIGAMADGLLSLIKLPDPAGIISETVRPNGLKIKKVAVPMGVIGIIYESRPNVTSDAAALCFKSSNVCILRGGKEAYNSSRAVVDALKEGLRLSGITEDAVNLVDDITRQSSAEMMTAKGYIDLLIPRGGKGLISACVENATVPCIETGTGICHVYVDRSADIEAALNIIDNAKTSRPSVCNAAEVCLVDEAIADVFLPLLKKRLTDGREHPVKLIGDEKVCRVIDAFPAGKDDFDTEFLDYVLAVKTVSGVSEAVEHILCHSTGHSEAIVARDEGAAKYFVENTDSAAVYVNASTRFTDGGEFGLGCEMGISTQKLHARGPMGLAELMTYKYVVEGEGQIR